MVKPLSSLLKKKLSFEWKGNNRRHLKTWRENFNLSFVEVSNFTKLFKGHTNASDFVIKGILVQDGHPIGFESKKLYGTQL